MQASPNDVYRPPSLNETPGIDINDRGRFESEEINTRESRVNAVRSELEKLNFGKAALANEAPSDRITSSAAIFAQPEQRLVDANEIIPYIRHIGEFIAYEREEVMNNGWSV